ncbi:ETX/MTX2 family pore-forming toxin [Bacillus toyonensis]|uniref:Uncharacterized protein n=1 Tax=Bacillus toyonensis TaxID=155322 RepID=A0A2B5WQ19_9BACI|nr:ETX/MTX2 family pore-forming toxin [Bacillus toyonensis]PGA86224.1 hypothetical protein COL93_29675 [Bacillus toyonensis]PHD55415.1 hypothetical protein COF40_30080 [Bacillus toyonensis]
MKFKKIATVIPLIGILSFGPGLGLINTAKPALAESLSSTGSIIAGSYNNMDEYQKKMQEAVNQVRNNPAAYLNDPVFKTVLSNMNLSTLQLSNPVIENVHYIDNNFTINAQPIEYQDSGNFELGSFKNETSQTQKYSTTSKTQSVSESMTYSNSEQLKLGLSSETSVKVDLPFFAEGSEKITVSSEFTYNHSDSNTKTTTISETFPSQTVECRPGYITTFVGTIKNAKFKGTYNGKAKATVKITYSGKSKDGYAIRGVISYDNTILNNTTSFSGIAGKYHEMQVKETPINGGPSTQRSLAQHQKLFVK